MQPAAMAASVVVDDGMVILDFRGVVGGWWVVGVSGLVACPRFVCSQIVR